MIYRMITSSVTWAAASLMVVNGKLQNRDLQSVLVAATLSTIAAWALQPPASFTAKARD
jgi:hypothetical protein